MDTWIKENMQGIMMAIGGASLLGIVALFVIFYVVKRNIKAKQNQ